MVKGIGGGAVTFSGKVEIDVGLPSQDCSLVTLEIVWAHMRMQVAPVVVGGSRVVVAVVATFVGDVTMMADGSNVRSNRRGLDAGKAGHAGELLSRGGFWGLELTVDVIRGGGGQRKR